MSRLPILCLEIITLYYFLVIVAGWTSGNASVYNVSSSSSLESHKTSSLSNKTSSSVSNKQTSTLFPSKGYLADMFNPRDVFASMTDDLPPKLTGTINLPPCIKNLLNCWEMLNPDVLCKFNRTPKWGHEYAQVRFDTICMDLRFQCREYTGPVPFPKDRPSTQYALLDVCAESVNIVKEHWYYYP